MGETFSGDMYGTVHWCGTVDGRPAIELTYYGGSTLWSFHVPSETDAGGWVPDCKTTGDRGVLIVAVKAGLTLNPDVCHKCGRWPCRQHTVEEQSLGETIIDRLSKFEKGLRDEI